jgi:pimeloyl-ACP methyl ester carboxylesterase
VIHLRLRDGTRVAYERFGRVEGPTALLLDGISCDGFIWPFLRPYLAERFDVIHPHYRGHGQSGLPRDMTALTVGHLTEDVNELLAELGVQDAVVFSHSMGVQVTLDLAARHPERVRAGVLLCGASGRLLDTFKETDLGMKLMPAIASVTERYRGTIGRFLRFAMPTAFATMVAGFGEPNRRLISPKLLRGYMEHIATMQPDVITRLLLDASERSGTHLLGRIQQPMLVVAGDQDGFTPPDVSRAMADALPNARYVLLKEGTHTAPLELPRDTESAITRFCDDLDHGYGTETRATRQPLAAAFRARTGQA